MRDEDAATLGLGVTTVGQGLYQTLQLPLPTHPATDSPPILIWGGSTATGQLGIQFAAVADVVYRRALEAGRGRDLPTEWFTQEEKP